MKKVNVKSLMWAWIVVSTAIIAVMLISIRTSRAAVRNERKAETSGMTALKSAAQLQKGSDTLTYSAWRFVATGDTEYASNFLYERNVSRSREEALSSLHKLGLSDHVLEPAENAKKTSDDLLQHELYAMRLVYEGMELSPIPDQIMSVELTPEDASLSGAQKTAEAKAYVFGSEYQHMKQTISDSIAKFYDELEAEIDVNVSEAAACMDAAKNVQLASQIIMFLWLFVLLAMIYRALIGPLLSYSRSIESQADGNGDRDLDPSGLYETRRLGQAYNKLLQQVRENSRELNRQNDDLRQLSQLDFLTKIASRLTMENYIRTLMESGGRFRFSATMLDIDFFKAFNDKYGHPMGDEALKIVAGILKETAEEYHGMAARIGGEEFMTVLPGADSRTTRQYAERALSRIIEAKIPLENQEAAHITASIGGYTYLGGSETLKDIYRNADKALYHAKSMGRSRYVAFEEIAASNTQPQPDDSPR